VTKKIYTTSSSSFKKLNASWHRKRERLQIILQNNLKFKTWFAFRQLIWLELLIQTAKQVAKVWLISLNLLERIKLYRWHVKP